MSIEKIDKSYILYIMKYNINNIKMLSKLRLLNKSNISYYTRKHMCNISLKEKAPIITNKYYNKDIEYIMKDVKILKEKYNDICDYNLIKFLLNYKSFDNKYDVNIIINEINDINTFLKLSNNEVLDIIIALKQKNYMNTKKTEETIESLSYLGIIIGLGVIIAII